MVGDNGSSGADGSVDALYARIQAAAAGTPYRLCRTEPGFDLIVDVDVPQWQELLTRRRINQVYTYRVALHPEKKTYTLTDVVHTVEYEVGPGGVRLGTGVAMGRSLSRTSYRTMDGTEQYTFSTAEGHRLIRDAARALGWRETQPASVKVALGFGILGGLGAVATLIALAIVNWL
ncbi:hypothetical protein [Streptomyces odontomachi]|uniref:hypothetical protein n=1 Tax=Streptomyces odontomachi TaxID=2944940 RepID=UPI00210C999D|nr:hypothetical protein [Streptomyces sp. ODS25]